MENTYWKGHGKETHRRVAIVMYDDPRDDLFQSGYKVTAEVKYLDDGSITEIYEDDNIADRFHIDKEISKEEHTFYTLASRMVSEIYHDKHAEILTRSRNETIVHLAQEIRTLVPIVLGKQSTKEDIQ